MREKGGGTWVVGIKKRKEKNIEKKMWWEGIYFGSCEKNIYIYIYILKNGIVKLE
jgi:hypothetical protein